LASAEKDIHLKIPVRVIKNNIPEQGLSKSDFALYINKERRDISKLFGNTMSLSKPDGLRNFVLAFNLTEYGTQISEGISHFVETILRETDSLILVTPIKMYRIKVNNKKIKIIEDIEKIVKKDSLEYKKNKATSRENLLREIRKVNKGGSITVGGGRMSTTDDLTEQTILQFLNNYSREWNNFKTKFLFPDMRMYGTVASVLAKQEGEKWFVNFQQREIMPALGEFNKARDAIKDYLSSLTGQEQATAGSISSGLSTVTKSMLISENFPKEYVLNLLMGVNLNYNVILFKNMRQDVSSPDDHSPDYEGILREIAKKTGGVSIDTTNLKEGIDFITKNKDFYYDLIFKFNGKVEDKEIDVQVTKSDTKVYHKNKFIKGEIQTLINYLKEPKVKVAGCSVKGHKLKFSLTDFKIETSNNQKMGAVRVKIELIDSKHNVVYHTQNTLKSIKKSINISLNLPAKIKGYFELRISATDLFSGKKDVFSEYIKLK
jgi:hypothetical protein